MRLPWLEVTSMVHLPLMANDVGEYIIEVEAFLDASSFSYNRVILDAYHFFSFCFHTNEDSLLSYSSWILISIQNLSHSNPYMTATNLIYFLFSILYILLIHLLVIICIYAYKQYSFPPFSLIRSEHFSSRIEKIPH